MSRQNNGCGITLLAGGVWRLRPISTTTHIRKTEVHLISRVVTFNRNSFIGGLWCRGRESNPHVLTSFYDALPSRIYRRFSRQSKLRPAWCWYITPSSSPHPEIQHAQSRRHKCQANRCAVSLAEVRCYLAQTREGSPRRSLLLRPDHLAQLVLYN